MAQTKIFTEKICISSNFLLLFLGYILIIWGFEAVDFFAFLLGTSQETLFSRAIVIAFFILLIVHLNGKIYVKHKKINNMQKAVCIIIFAISFFKILYPDTSYDTFNYHLLAQEPGFINYMVDGLGGGNFQIWGFRLSDRLFYMFRYFGGYRAGTFFNSLITVLIYLTLSDLMNDVMLSCNIKNVEEKKKNILETLSDPAIVAGIVVFNHQILMQMGTYCVDLIVLPLCLELIRNTILDEVKNNRQILFYAFLMGIIVSMKLTNILIILVCFLIFIYNYWKKISIFLFLKCFCLGVLPSSIYIIFNYLCTGNPAYPYFNSIFKSVYFSLRNFKDRRFGPTTWLENIIWPFNIAFNPDFRLGEIYNKHTIWLKIAIIIFILVFCIYIYKILKRKKINKIILQILIIYYFYMFLWGITTGIERYAIIGYCIIGLLACIVINYIINKYRSKTVFIIVSTCLCVSVAECILEVRSVYDGEEWSFRKVTLESVKEQLSYLFKDFKEEMDNIEYFCLTESLTSGIAYLLNKDAPIYFVDYLENISDEQTMLQKRNNVYNILDSNKNIYGIYYKQLQSWEDYIEKLNKIGMKITHCYDLDMDKIVDITLVKLERAENTLNTLVELDGSNISVNVDKEKSMLTGIVFMKWPWFGINDVTLQVEAIDIESGNKIKLWDGYINSEQPKFININFDKLNKGHKYNINFQAYYPDGNAYGKDDNGNPMYLLNPIIY